MAVCRTCERVLSANGSCLYCGTGLGKDAAGKPVRRRANWVRRILLLVLVAGLIHFFFISPTGRNLIKPAMEKVGLGKYFSTD